MFQLGVGDPETCDRLIGEAAHVVRLRLRIPRIVVSALEPRAAVGLYDPATAQYRLIATTQGVHFVAECWLRHAGSRKIVSGC